MGQVLTAGADSAVSAPMAAAAASAQSNVADAMWHDAMVMPRPDVLNSKTVKQPTPFGNLYVTVSEWNPGDPFEVFATIGKAGSDIQAMTEAACRSISQLLRIASPLTRQERLLLIIEQFEGIGGYATSGFGSERVRSIPDAIAKALRRYLGQNVSELDVQLHTMGLITEPHAPARDLPMASVSADHPVGRAFGAICPDCGQTAVYMSEGCMTCQSCGFSQC